MKVAFLVTSSGGSFYCSNCYRDMLYFRAVRLDKGVNATAIPLYLPPEKAYIESGFDTNVFFGAISLFIREKVPFLEQMPSFIDKILDAPPLLKLAAKRAGTTSPEGMEDLTLNMIDGNHSSREKEVERLVKYMSGSGKPDVIHLSNALIIGLAKQIKNLLDVKIVCSLQNEDDWINDMAEPFQSKAWKMIGAESEFIDAFIAPSNYYKEFFISKTGLPGEKIHVVASGIDIDAAILPSRKTPEPAIGYFSRVNYHNGFDKLADAFIAIKKDPAFENITLHICGGFTADDKPFIREQITKLKENGFKSSVKIYPEFQGQSKQDFFSAIDLLSVPVRKYDGYGLYILESNAAGIPVVQPGTGAFPEILAKTNGGVIYNPDNIEELIRNIKALLTDKERALSLGMEGRKAVQSDFTLEKMSGGLNSVYRNLMAGH